jgi:hypothetical protein
MVTPIHWQARFPATSHWIYTMSRCSIGRRPALVHAIAIGVLGWAQALPQLQPGAQAQVLRNFPATALRGEIFFGQPPEIELNGQAARLAPGARIRNTENLLAMSGALKGERLWVHYTLEDTSGLVHQVWILRAEELRKRPWPTTPEEARNWVFDPAAQTWSRR